MEEVETVDVVDEVIQVCQHPKLQYKKAVVSTATTDTASLQLSGFYCPDCNHKFVAAMGKGYVDAVLIPLVSMERVVRVETEKAKPQAKETPAQPKKPEPLGPGPGTELHDELTRLGIPACQACKALARKMNEWGVEESRKRIDEIVEDVLPRAKAWFDHASLKEKMGVWWNSDQRLSSALTLGTKASTKGLDEALKDVIRKQVIAAIDRFEAQAG